MPSEETKVFIELIRGQAYFNWAIGTVLVIVVGFVVWFMRRLVVSVETVNKNLPKEIAGVKYELAQQTTALVDMRDQMSLMNGSMRKTEANTAATSHSVAELMRLANTTDKRDQRTEDKTDRIEKEHDLYGK
jgi:hypothetical protein